MTDNVSKASIYNISLEVKLFSTKYPKTTFTDTNDKRWKLKITSNNSEVWQCRDSLMLIYT